MQVFPASMKSDGSGKPAAPRDLFTRSNLDKFKTDWDKKVNTAFFRGNATGGGVTTDTNQRLHLAQTSHDWSFVPARNGSTGAAPFLDAKITGWNLRDKKIAGRRMSYVHSHDFAFDGSRARNFVEIYKQASYKYLLYAEGHCAACRYGFMMLLGSVILKVESKCVADQMWYFPLLRPFVDHVPVMADLSDLLERLQWCHAHDAECKIIAQNAKTLYQNFVSRDGVLDYLQTVCCGIAERWQRPPAWSTTDLANPLPAPTLPPYLQGEGRFCCEDHENDINALCSYCEASKRAELSLKRRRQIESYPAGLGGADDDQARGRVKIKTREEEVAEKNRALKERKKQIAAEARAAALLAKTEGSAH